MKKQPKLKGKTIRIGEYEFTATESFLDVDTMEDVVVLRRKADWLQDADQTIPPSTIYDLGYIKADDIIYSDGQLIEKASFLDNHIGEDIKIAMVEPSGIIRIETVNYLGALLSDPDICRIQFSDGIRQMKVEFLLTASILADEYQSAIDKYNAGLDFKNSEAYDKILNDLKTKRRSKKTYNDIEENFETLIQIFDKFFTDRFNDIGGLRGR